LSEALKYLPGVDVKVNTEFGQASSLSMNGSDSRQVLLMVDGIPFNTQLSGQANPARVPLEIIDRIEIIKGGLSSVWGSSLGGVINVITKDTGSKAGIHGTLNSSYGEFATIRNSFDMSGKAGKAGYFLAGSFLDTDGPMAATEAKEKKGFGKL